MEQGIAKNRLKYARKNAKRMKVGVSWLNTKLLGDGFSRLDAFGRPI